MLSGVMRELVDWKWDLFGRQILLANFLVYFLFLISYLTGMYIRKPAPPTTVNEYFIHIQLSFCWSTSGNQAFQEQQPQFRHQTQ